MKGVESTARYVMPMTCSAVNCIQRDVERHHIFRRSFLIGDYWWAQLPDGEVVGNCIPLCNHHHKLVSENVVAIEYHDGRFFSRMGIGDAYELNWQPPFYTSMESFLNENRDSKTPEKKMEVSDLSTGRNADSSATDPDSFSGSKTSYPESESVESETMSASASPATCPTCERPLPKPKIETPMEERKIRRTWSVSVPVDRQEDGAEVLDTLLEEVRDELARAGLPYGDSEVAKYHPLATALALFVTNAREILHG